MFSKRFEPSMSGSLFDAYLVSKIATVHDFMPDLKVVQFMPVIIMPTTLLKVVLVYDFMPNLEVVRFMPVVISHTTLVFYLQRTKLFIRTETNFRTFCLRSSIINFFTVTRVNICLLFIKYKWHFPNQHQKLYHISKAQTNTFLTGTLMPLLWQNPQERRRSTPFKVRYRKLKTLWNYPIFIGVSLSNSTEVGCPDFSTLVTENKGGICKCAEQI